ncbi:GNAT family N-acetyltransferase [Clostridium subterminale]|uniref:GNAT family N-acetyltransferase n=1 Tax=Clostridium subterminale TaxID=1550 RepID=A0ABN1KRX6_CLOSU
MINIRRAKLGEASILTNIAINSEAYWGYDEEYMESFKNTYGVSENYISNYPTFLMEDNQIIVGFYSILMNVGETELEYFFINPNYIGKGYGKLLWNHVIENAKNLNIKQLEIVTSPEAIDFYIKMGAVKIGEVESLVKVGRKIPRLIYNVEK